MAERALLPIGEVRDAMYLDEQQHTEVFGLPIRLLHLRAVLDKQAEPSTDVAAIADDLAEFGPRFASLKDVRQSRALKAVFDGANIKTACATAGVSYSGWYHWRYEDPEFEALYQQMLVARATRQMEDVDEVEKNLIDRAKSETDAARVVLRAWKPERYREKQTIEVVSPDVVMRLEQQAQALIDAAKEVITAENVTRLPAKDLAALVASTQANKLREIWA